MAARTSTVYSGKRSLRGRVERFLLGIAMGIAAFVIERRVLRAIKKSGETPPEPVDDAFDELINEGIRISD
jgi:hypothetical protein